MSEVPLYHTRSHTVGRFGLRMEMCIGEGLASLSLTHTLSLTQTHSHPISLSRTHSLSPTLPLSLSQAVPEGMLAALNPKP